MNRILYTTGNNQFQEGTYTLPRLKDNQILVRSQLTGVCRSDIDMMEGKFNLLPIDMSGHEGLGIVERTGKDITDVQVGDYVATRGEPAYADFYNCEHYVKVPELAPKYILEPIACGINIVLQQEELKTKPNARVLISGSGLLAWVVYHTMKIMGYSKDITVIGNYNQYIWGNILQTEYTGKFDVIIDLSNRDLFNQDIYNTQATYFYAAQKSNNTNLQYLLWNAVTIVCPSPRAETFAKAMSIAKHYIETNQLNVDEYWTQGYNRDTEWQAAFTDAQARQNNYNKGFIDWR